MSQLRIGSRGSLLARTQAEQVIALLHEHDRSCQGRLVVVEVSGDRGDGGAGAPEDKRRWVDAIEDALLGGEIDLAVHSAKDLPGELAGGLTLAGAPARAPAEDVLCGATGLQALAPGARVGTSSIRRLAQLRSEREDLELVAMRGNVDTRLAKLAAARAVGDRGTRPELDAIVLARAGLSRLGREREIGAVLDPARFVPAPGQGTLALQTRTDDGPVREAIEAITDHDALACLLAERALARGLGASCDTPLGAHATRTGSGLRLRAWAGLPDGSAWIADELLGDLDEPEGLGQLAAERMDVAGAGELLARAA
jgi:hydroxymethylbilane synthase